MTTDLSVDLLPSGGYVIAKGGRWASAHPLRGRWPWKVQLSEERGGYWARPAIEGPARLATTEGYETIGSAFGRCMEWLGLSEEERVAVLIITGRTDAARPDEVATVQRALQCAAQAAVTDCTRGVRAVVARPRGARRKPRY